MFSMCLCKSASCGGMLLISWFKRVWCEHANFLGTTSKWKWGFRLSSSSQGNGALYVCTQRKLYYTYICSWEWWEIEIFINISGYPFFFTYITSKWMWKYSRRDDDVVVWKKCSVFGKCETSTSLTSMSVDLYEA